MENTPLDSYELHNVDNIFEIAKEFISGHAVSELQENLGQMFACYVSAMPNMVLNGVPAHDVAQTFVDLMRFVNRLALEIPDLHAQDYMELGQGKSAA